MKYYFIKYTITDNLTHRTIDSTCVADKHPFEWLKFFDSFSNTWSLVFWDEISEDEYNIGKTTIGIG